MIGLFENYFENNFAPRAFSSTCIQYFHIKGIYIGVLCSRYKITKISSRIAEVIAMKKIRLTYLKKYLIASCDYFFLFKKLFFFATPSPSPSSLPLQSKYGLNGGHFFTSSRKSHSKHYHMMAEEEDSLMNVAGIQGKVAQEEDTLVVDMLVGDNPYQVVEDYLLQVARGYP